MISFKLKIFYYLLKLKLEKFLGLKYNLIYKKIKIFFYLINLRKSEFYKSFNVFKHKFSDLPIMNKEIFMKNFDSINTAGISYNQANILAENAEKSRNFNAMIEDISVGLSTGTSGNRGIFLLNSFERAKWVAHILDRVIVNFNKKHKVAFFLRANNKLYESTNSNNLSFNFFDIYSDMNSHIFRLNSILPDILIGQPSILIMLSEKITNGELKIKPSKIISVAEVLEEKDKKLLQRIFNVSVSEVYQCSEGFLASTCEHGTLHFNEDFLIIEKKYLDSDKTKFIPIVTDLLRTTQPIVRYQMNDIITEKKSCKCNSKFLAIQSIDGRSDDLFSLKNSKSEPVVIFPDLIRRTIVLSDKQILDYAFVQTKKNIFELYILSELNNSYEKAKKSLLNLFQKYDVKDFKILKKEFQKNEIGLKKRRIRNEIK